MEGGTSAEKSYDNLNTSRCRGSFGEGLIKTSRSGPREDLEPQGHPEFSSGLQWHVQLPFAIGRCLALAPAEHIGGASSYSGS